MPKTSPALVDTAPAAIKNEANSGPLPPLCAASCGSAGGAAGGRGVPRMLSQALFGGAQEVEIEHRGAVYRLRQTSLGKLILTK